MGEVAPIPSENVLAAARNILKECQFYPEARFGSFIPQRPPGITASRFKKKPIPAKTTVDRDRYSSAYRPVPRKMTDKRFLASCDGFRHLV